MAKTIQQIRIFISSPSDVKRERESAQIVIEELNRTLCSSIGLSLFPLTWEKNTYPAVGEYSQDVINQQIGEYDIFVGIMANRFGTKTQSADSGTEEEFNIAYNNRKNTHIMFFFKDVPISPTKVDTKQLNKVSKFKKKLPNKGVYYKEFTDDFERVFRECLTQCINQNYMQKDVKLSNDKSKRIEQLKTEVEEYLFSHNPTYKKYSSVNALAIPNSQFKLKDVYIAQTLEKDNRFDKEKDTTKIEQLPVELIKKYKKILIKDTAGMGKSTIMKYMFVNIIDNNIRDVGIPIYIELNRLNKDCTILNKIQEEMNSISNKFDNDSLLHLFNMGSFIFFMDGYDEISIADRDEVTKDIQNFINNAGSNNFYILTSRPEERLASFGDFQSFNIKPLIKKEAYGLLKKYDISSQKCVSAEIIKELKTGKYNSIDEYLKNPLLVSLLYSAYQYKAEIPLQKHQFYKQVYNALYDAHKFAQGQVPHEKRSGLDIDNFNRVLRFIGFDCLKSIGVRFDEDTILRSIRTAKDFSGNLNFSESDFLKDLLTSVPLFCKDGTEYKWAHKSLMEYFAARFIADDLKKNQEKILKNVFISEDITKYINMLDLYYDIDNYGFIKYIELPLLLEYKKYYEENYFESSRIEKKYIEERIGYLYAQTICVDIFDRKLYHHDLFEDIRERIKNNFGFLANSVTITSAGFVIGYLIQPQKKILSILSKKKDELFERVKRKTTNNVEEMNISKRIDIHTGEEDENTYKEINNLITQSPRENSTYLNYQKCCNEIKRINNIIMRNEDTLALLEGL